jgi:hypothetical protein
VVSWVAKSGYCCGYCVIGCHLMKWRQWIALREKNHQKSWILLQQLPICGQITTILTSKNWEVNHCEPLFQHHLLGVFCLHFTLFRLSAFLGVNHDNSQATDPEFDV